MAPRKKDPNAPKKGLTDFMIFQQERRQEVRTANPDATFGEIGKLLGDMWKKLSKEEKQKYQVKSAADKERYKKEKEEYDQNKQDEESSSNDDEKPAKKRQKKDPNKPKGALSAYMFFNREIRPQIASENPDAGFGEVGKIIGAKWKSMNAAQKKKYEDMAADDKKRFEKDMKEYNGGSSVKPTTKKAPAKKPAKVEDDDDDDANDDDDDDDNPPPANDNDDDDDDDDGDD